MGVEGEDRQFLKSIAVFSHVASTRAQTMYTERDINTCTSHCGNFGERGEGRQGDEMLDGWHSCAVEVTEPAL